MTLCLAWKKGNSISFASDSRLTGGWSINSDMATKIYKINVRVSKQGSNELVYNLSYGLCFCGSYLNGSVFADAIGEILSSLQIKDGVEIDGKSVMKIAFEVFSAVSNHLGGLHREKGFSRILIGGKCPKSNEVEVYHFNWKYKDGNEGIEYTMTQENFNPSFVPIGDSDATKLADSLKSKINYASPLYTEYHLLKEIIDDGNIRGVGGPIQTGHFINGDFRIFGMVDYEISPLPPDGKLVWARPVYTFMGIPIDEALDVTPEIKINTSKIFMAPFTDKEKELTKKAQELNSLKE